MAEKSPNRDEESHTLPAENEIPAEEEIVTVSELLNASVEQAQDPVNQPVISSIEISRSENQMQEEREESVITDHAEAKKRNLTQLQRIREYAKEKGFLAKMQTMLPKLDEYIFVDIKNRMIGYKYDPLPFNYNQQILFLGGTSTQNIWALLKEFPDQAAQVYLEVDDFDIGVVDTMFIKECGHQPYMHPFWAIAARRDVNATTQLKAFCKYIFLACGVAQEPHVFAPEATHFRDLKIAVSKISKAYHGKENGTGPIITMHRPMINLQDGGRDSSQNAPITNGPADMGSRRLLQPQKVGGTPSAKIGSPYISNNLGIIGPSRDSNRKRPLSPDDDPDTPAEKRAAYKVIQKALERRNRIKALAQEMKRCEEAEAQRRAQADTEIAHLKREIEALKEEFEDEIQTVPPQFFKDYFLDKQLNLGDC